MGPKLTTRDFIQKARSIHGDRYDYSKVNYINAHGKVIIICQHHGEFYQIPNDHLSKHGCRKCGNKIIKDSKISNITQFIEKAKAIHGDKYDYSKFIYKGNKVKGCIICQHHGEFYQIPNSHLNNQGCSKCANIHLSNIKKLTQEQFIEKAKAVHGNNYDYINVNYINSKTKIDIKCKKHGYFLQTPDNHINRKAGCPKCNFSKGELALQEIFKKYNIEAEPQYNIPEIVANYEIDFYLPKYNLLIEFHGRQHYEYIPFFHDNDRGWDLDAQKRRDELVRDAAVRWKYNYLEFNYKQLKHLSQKQFEELVVSGINRFKFFEL